MDNKQDRLFYWEVKDFLKKTKNPDINSVKRASSLKEDITKIMSLNSPFYVDKDLVQPRISNDIRNSVLPLIALNESSIKKGTPRNVGSSPNITSNLFNLTEAPAGSFGGGGSSVSLNRRSNSGKGSWKDENPEKYAANVDAADKQEKNREIQRGINKRRAQEDETLAYNTANSGSPLPMTAGIANDTAENRENLRNFRTKRDNERQSTQLANVINRTSNQDPSTLSAKDAGELALAKIMMKGGSLSKPNASLESSIKSKVAGMQGKPALSSELSGSGNQMQDDIDALADANKTPEQAAQEAAARTTATARSKAYFDADTESSFASSRDATQRDVAQREKDNIAYKAQQAATRYEKMQGANIQGTNMTYGEFKSNTGRDYDATNREDSSLVIRQAGAMGGRYSSAEARDLAGSTDSMINMQRNASDARVAEGGRLTRTMDRSAQALSNFQNNPEIRAQEIAKDKASVMPQVMAQINAETSKRDRLEGEGRSLAAGDKAAALTASLAKNSTRIPSRGYIEPGKMGPPAPRVPFMLGGTEQRAAPQPFLPTPTGGDNANLAAGRADVRAREQNQRNLDDQAIQGRKREQERRQQRAVPGKAGDADVAGPVRPAEYGTSLLSDIMNSGASDTSKAKIAPGSPKAIKKQISILRGQ
jgi:hypothetical protein